MLIWKTQTLNVNVASVRYRCLLPLRYLAKRGVNQTIFGGLDPVKITAQTEAIVFVKSFRDEDVETCEQASRLGVPIILDLCDNIFIEEYAAGNDYVPARNFRQMVRRAAVVVTTGEALKKEIESAIAPLNVTIPIIIIPDGSETLSDIDDAFRTTRWQRLKSLVILPSIKRLLKPVNRLRRGLRVIALRVIYAVARRVFRALCQTALCQGSPCLCPPYQLDPLQPFQPSQSAKPSASLASANPPKPITSAKSIVQPTPWFPTNWPAAAPGTKTILWFGNHGAKYGSFGMSGILDVAEAIERLSQEQPLRLVVVSNSRDKYEQYIEPLPFETRYLRWHPRSIYDYIKASDVVIIPNSQSVYSICKSANRAVLSLSQGTPVVASRTPALNLFEGCVILDAWEDGLRQYLLNPEIAQMHVALAQRAIAQTLSGDQIAQQWLSVLGIVTNRVPAEPSSTEAHSTAATPAEYGSHA